MELEFELTVGLFLCLDLGLIFYHAVLIIDNDFQNSHTTINPQKIMGILVQSHHQA